MIEIPESYSLAAQLKEHLLGKTAADAIAAKSPHGFAGYSCDSAEFGERLRGKTVTGTCRFGGFVEIELGDTKLAFDDGIRIRLYEPGAKLPEKHQLMVEFADGYTLICTIQMYGGFTLTKDGEFGSTHYQNSRAKIDPMSDECTLEHFTEQMNNVKPNYSAKAFLATEQRFPGLGNGVLQDILFNARINPRKKIQDFTQDEKLNLYKVMRETLAEMITNNGRDTTTDILGNKGGYETILSSKTINKPCPICGDAIVKEAFMGGSVYYCPTCQPYEKKMPRKKD